MIALDDFQLALAIHTGQYASFDTISFVMFYLHRNNGALFLPNAGHAFLIVTALQCFSLTSYTTVKNHTKAKM